MSETKLISILLVVVVLVGICVLLAFCEGQNQNRKMDVSIRIVCEEVDERGRLCGTPHGAWIFTPGLDEIYIEREYDGKQYLYYVQKYNFPRYSDEWFTPTGYGGDAFSSSLWKSEIESGQEMPKVVCDKGEYCFTVNALGISDLWNERTVKLFITVK